MSKHSVNVSIDAVGSLFNDKIPELRIYHNQKQIDHVKCNQLVNLSYDVDASDTNCLEIELFNKSFGENNHWDVSSDQELQVKILDIRLNDVSIGHLLTKLKFNTNWSATQLANESQEFLTQYQGYYPNGVLIFNGKLVFNYRAPVYPFLIESKFKQEYNPGISAFSNLSETFNYDLGNKEVEQILDILKNHEQH